MQTVFRVDASRQIGSGHLMRCLTLANQLQKLGTEKVIFVSRDLEGNLFSLVGARGYEICILPRHDGMPRLNGYAAWLTVSQEIDAEETLSAISQYGKISWLIVDSYAIDETWENMVGPYVSRIMAIDDLANRRHNVDVLLDQNFSPGRDKDYACLVPQDCKLLMGLDYLLLRDEFYAAKNKVKQRNGEIQRVLVFFGGVDLTDETSKTLDAMELFPALVVDVVVGGSNPQAEKIAARCRKKANWQYHYQIDYMASLMAKADLAIGAGGTATWERGFLGLPSLVISVADNQSGGARYYDSLAIWKYLGEAAKVTTSDIVAAVRLLQSDTGEYLRMQNTLQKLFENHVQGRVANILLHGGE